MPHPGSTIVNLSMSIMCIEYDVATVFHRYIIVFLFCYSSRAINMKGVLGMVFFFSDSTVIKCKYAIYWYSYCSYTASFRWDWFLGIQDECSEQDYHARSTI